jgi:hypothetical protein
MSLFGKFVTCVFWLIMKIVHIAWLDYANSSVPWYCQKQCSFTFLRPPVGNGRIREAAIRSNDVAGIAFAVDFRVQVATSSAACDGHWMADESSGT